MEGDCVDLQTLALARVQAGSLFSLLAGLCELQKGL